MGSRRGETQESKKKDCFHLLVLTICLEAAESIPGVEGTYHGVIDIEFISEFEAVFETTLRH
jgi:hypothetical protein